MNYAQFQKIVAVSKQEICREIFALHRSSIRVKKEATAVKNLARIFDAALAISNRKGFQAMSMRDLSSEAGLSMGALYSYFSSKDQLLEMLQNHGRTIATRVMGERVSAEADPAARLRTAVRTHLYLSEAMQPWFYFSYMEAKNLTKTERDKAIESELQTEKVFADILRDGGQAGVFLPRDYRLTATVMKAMVQDWYLKRWKYTMRRISVDRYADFVLEFVESFVLPPRTLVRIAKPDIQCTTREDARMDVTDRAVAVRKDEELDPEKIRRFLVETIPNLRGDITIKQFPSGYSNLTYLVTVGDTELVLRRPPFGRKARTAHDMGREYRMLSALRPVFPYCPRPLVYGEDESVIGCSFYVMEPIRGIILRRDLPSGLSFSPEQARRLCERLIDVHIELHSLDYRGIGLGDFAKPDGYVERQVVGWSERYRAARTDDAPDFADVMAWIREKMPPDTDRPTIIHNDYRFDNVVLDEKDPMRIIGVLDWEMATIGDPLMDLGNSICYWVQKDDPPEMQLVRLMPEEMGNAFTRDEIVQRYEEKSGRSIAAYDFYYCFGLFRLAVIAQQIYYRSYHGQTQDERFKALVFAVRALENAARRVIDASKL